MSQNTLNDQVGMAIKLTRIRQRRSQEELAGEVGLTRNAYANRESGRVPVTVEELVRIAQALGVLPGWLLAQALALEA